MLSVRYSLTKDYLITHATCLPIATIKYMVCHSPMIQFMYTCIVKISQIYKKMTFRFLTS